MSLLLCHHVATTGKILWEVMVMVRRMYAVVFPTRVDFFSESMAGVLDYHSSCPWETQEKILPSFAFGPELPGSDCSKPNTFLEWHLFPLQGAVAKVPIVTIPTRDPRVYITSVGEPVGFESDGGCALDSIPSPIIGFLLRYPAFRSAMDSSDFLAVAHMLVNSKELTAYHALLRFLAGPMADYPLLWYFLHDQDSEKTAMVDAYLVRRRIAEAQEYPILFKFSNRLDLCRSLSEFQVLANELIAQKWSKGDFLRTEIAGLAFNIPGMTAYIRIVTDVMTLEIGNRLQDRCEAEQFEQRILERLERIAPLVVERDLINPYDAQAIAVYGATYGGKRIRLGYIKPDLAHILCKFGGFSTAKLALLDTDVVEILVRREES